ncbi:MAG: hypothetical protein HFK06_06695 [Clostridia bacterium]|nr:hypothetical protein [Clostridia bacterium]
MDNLKKDLRETADTAEAEKEITAAPDLGKFKDVQTLLKAYSDLEAEFTRRSQRLKELEHGNKAETEPDGAEASPSRQDELLKRALSDDKVRDAVIGEYLKGVAEGKGVTLLSGGGGVSAPRAVPKSVKEAGKLASEFLKN